MSNIIKHQFNGMDISFEGKEKVSLTDMWKASGSVETQHPKFWLGNDEPKRFMNKLAENLNVTPSYLLNVKRGKYGGTWAHWQIALAYAQYLSPEFHMFINQCFVNYAKEEASPDLKMDRAIDSYRRKGKSDNWIDTRFRSKLSNRGRNAVLASRQGGNGNIYALCSDATNKAILNKSSSEYKLAFNLSKSASIRDHMSTIELLQITLTEEVSSERIKENNVFGNLECAHVHDVIGSRIHNAISMRGI